MTHSGGGAVVKQTHPIRGLLWGILFGLGLAVVLVVTSVIPLELSQMAIVAVVGIAIGVAWGLFGPAKAPKGSAPAGVAPTTMAPVGDENMEPDLAPEGALEEAPEAGRVDPEPGIDEI